LVVGWWLVGWWLAGTRHRNATLGECSFAAGCWLLVAGCWAQESCTKCNHPATR
jgi:hypothetical protein